MTSTTGTPTTGADVLQDLTSALLSGRLDVVDLTTPLSADTPTLRLPEPYSNLIDFRLEEVSAFDEAGPLWRHHNIHTGEHIGTHLDAPRHWISHRDGDDVASVPVRRLVGPAAVVDRSVDAAHDPEFLLEVDHIREWEADNGPLPEDGWLLYRTGWDARGGDQDAFLNVVDGVSRTPGISAECARWLATETRIAGFGVETVGIDAGNGFALEPPMPAHHHLLANDRYGVTSLRNLRCLPATGAVVVVGALPIVAGTGSPARVLAFVPTPG